MIPFNKEEPKSPFTALFFKEHNVESLIDAVYTFDKLNINPYFIRKHAEKFDDKNFIDKIKNFVYLQYTTFKEENKFQI